jgi:hypothetical protein
VTILVEAAVESLEAALAAAEGGAHRLELCADLAHGGSRRLERRSCSTPVDHSP